MCDLDGLRWLDGGFYALGLKHACYRKGGVPFQERLAHASAPPSARVAPQQSPILSADTLVIGRTLCASRANHRSNIRFVKDALIDGRDYRCLNVVSDSRTREVCCIQLLNAVDQCCLN